MKNFRSRKRRSRSRGGIFKVFGLAVLVVCLLAVTGYAAFHIFVPAPTVETQVTFTTQQEPDTVELSSPETDSSFTTSSNHIVLNRTEGVFTCLLTGSDDGNGNADTIMLGVFDTNNGKASLISIPRDTLVEVDGVYRKINSTYGLGGTELVRDTVSDMLGVPIDYYISVDLDAFSAIVEEIGGVWFDVPVDMNYEDPTQDLYIHLDAGYQKLDAQGAIGVVRCRSCYPTADIGRISTQRDFLAALVSQTITPSNITKVTSLIKILNQYVETDMPLDTMLYFATQAIGIDLEQALTSNTLAGAWISPYYELDDQPVWELINSLGIYKEEMPRAVFNIQHA